MSAKNQNGCPVSSRIYKKNKVRKIIGDKGEIFVLEYEKNKLIKLGRDDLANQVEHVSEIQGDGTGYDIRSFDEAGDEIYIEVKTTTAPRNKPFNISWVEIERSKIEANKYYLYRIYNFDLNKHLRAHARSIFFTIQAALVRCLPYPAARYIFV